MSKSDLSLQFAAIGILLRLHLAPVVVLAYVLGLVAGLARDDRGGTRQG